MPKNKLEDLRNHLFEAIEMLKDGELNVENAKAIKGLGDTIVNTAKVELQFINMTKSTKIKSNFIEINVEPKQLAGVDELEDCKCGDPVYPGDFATSERLGLDYPRCAGCLELLPNNLDISKANSATN